MARLDLSDEAKNAVLALTREAENFSENNLAGPREKAWRYYQGEIDIPAPEDRSNVVITEVRNAVEMLMPPLMSVFLSTQRAVEFTSKTDPVGAEQATERCNECFMEQNNGWLIIHDSLKDAMIARSSVFKVFRESEQLPDEVEEFSSDDTDSMEVAQLLGATVEPVDDFTMRASYAGTNDVVRIEVLPPEQALIDSDAPDSDDPLLIGQKTKVRLGKMIEMGFDAEDIKELGHGEDTQLEQAERARKRMEPDDSSKASIQWALREVVLKEVYPEIDINDSGRLVRVKAFVVNDKVIDSYEAPDYDHPYVMFSIIRIPHSAIGMSEADILTDIQEQNSVFMRQVLDNLYWANSPAIGVLKSGVNSYQVENWGFGSIIDQKVPNAVQIYTIPFVADRVIPFLEYQEKVKESRVGTSRDATGLNPDALRTQTATAAAGIISASQRQVEMLARTYAQTGLVPLFKKIYYVLYGKRCPYDMKVNVGLGNGTIQERLQTLMMIIAQQEKILMSPLGLDNPIVTLSHYAAALKELTALSPFYNPAQFFAPPEQVQQYLDQQAQQPKESPPDPKMVEAQGKLQIAQQKAQVDTQVKQMQAQQKAQQTAMESAAKLELQRQELQSKMSLEEQRLANTMEIERLKAANEVLMAREELKAETRLEAMKVTLAAETDAEMADAQGNIPRSRR